MRSKCNASCLAALSVLMVISPLNMKASGNEWISTNGEWKYKEGDSYKTGWFADQKCWYYADYQTGILKKGWIASGDAWYYLNPVNAIMQESRWVDDGKYYIGNNGAMATDTVIDGKEILADGTYVPFSDSKSVVLKNAEDLAGKVIEGNLYITEEAAKDLVLSDVIVKGKIVIEGSNFITLNNVTASEIKNNKAETTIKFEGKTQVDKVMVTRSTNLMTDDQYKGMIKEIAIQSTTKTETIVNVKANEVTSTTYASTTINQEVGKVTLKQESSVQLNANVEELVVQASAGHSKVDVAKDVTVAKATISSESTLGGKGTITKLEAKVDNIKVDTKVNEIVVADGVKNPPKTADNVVAKPEESKPSGGAGGGGTGGGGSAGGDTDKEVKVTTIEGLETALKNSSNISIPKGTKLELSKNLTLASGKTLTIEDGGELILSKELTVNGELKTYGNIFSKSDVESKFRQKSVQSDDLRLNVKSGSVRALAGSEFRFDNINQIASSEASFMIYENSSLYINGKLKVGKTDAMVNLKPLQGVSAEKPLAAYDVNGDGTVGLIVLADATVNNGLDCIVSGWKDSIIRFPSDIQMVNYDEENSGFIDSSYDAKLFIGDEYVVGNDLINEKSAVFTGRDLDKSSISFSTLNGHLITGILGNTTINHKVPSYMSLYPRTNIIAKSSIVTNKSDFVVSLYTIKSGDIEFALSEMPQKLSMNEAMVWSDRTGLEWIKPEYTITEVLMDTEPTVSQVLYISTKPEYADFDVKWTVNGKIQSNTGYAYRVKEGDNKIVAEIFPKGDFNADENLKQVEATVTDSGVTTPESLYYKFLGEAHKIKISGNSITYDDSKNGLRLTTFSELIIEKGGKLVLGSTNENTNLIVMNKLNVENKDSIKLVHGKIELKSKATINVSGTESVGENGKDIRFLNPDAPEDRVTLSFTQSIDGGKGIIYIYDKVDMTQTTYNKLIESYSIVVLGDGVLTVDDNKDYDSVKTVLDLKNSLTNPNIKKIVINFPEGVTITESINIENKEVEVKGTLIFEEGGTLSLEGNSEFKLMNGSNVVMPSIFELDKGSKVMAMPNSKLKINNKAIIGGSEAQLEISGQSDFAPIRFSKNGDGDLLTFISGNVTMKGYDLSAILVKSGGTLNLKVGNENMKQLVTSDGGTILINGENLFTSKGPIILVSDHQSDEGIIQISDKSIILYKNITLNGTLPDGFKISPSKSYTIDVQSNGLSGEILDLPDSLSIGTYKVVDGKWTLQPKEPIKNEENIVNNEIEGSNESLLTE